MRLVDLLVQELPRRGGWPEGALNATQDKDGEVCFSADAVPEFVCIVWTGGDWCGNEFHTVSASDYATAIVTREQYEAALAASKSVVGRDGWIQWHGGKCPVDSDAIVEVKYRNPNNYQLNNDRAGDFYWSHNGFDGDIIAYRLQQPTKSEQACDDVAEADDEADLNECIGQAPVAEWNGEGLPPVGCECEYLNSNGEWSTVKVKYSSDQLIVISGATKILGEEQETEIAKDIIIDKPKFRPLRMGPERKRDAFINAVLDDMRSIPWACDLSLRDEVAVIYDAIAAGKIPGVKLEGK